MKSKDIKRRITVRNLTIFTIVVLLSGWIGHALNVLMDTSSEEGLGMLLWLVAPLLATLCLRAFAGDGWYDTGIKPLFRGNVKWYVVSLLIIPVLTVSIIFTGYIFGWITYSGFNVSQFLQIFALLLIPNFLKNIPEEFVWRGYLTPKLASLKINDFSLYLIVGSIWGAWHIPYYLYFLDSETINSFTSLSLEVFIPLCIVTTIAWTILFVEIWFLTRSIWPVVLMHMVEDAFVNPLVLDSSFQISGGKDLLIHPVIGIISIVLYVVVGLSLRRIRLKTQAQQV
ncbi:MAG: CPBP family intramembrane metalloprotease [ANME-2 cluster archaeon]|nr:CPBP family intramembrane metalloprotease [ANME-2 cluster archaeon]MBC2706127.1 CPBP family intramembrane metalloprotease [ANME-2 cluster archaeon]MBC2747216.1 CPBP family intramembrane metalloprotease [ANME-2 cluster archaeon]